MVIVAVGWLALLACRWRSLPRDPLLRACLLGAPLGLALFVLRSPFPEVRFCFPPFLLLFACLAVSLDEWIKPSSVAAAVAGVVFNIAWWTAQANYERSLEFAASGAVLAAVGLIALVPTRNWRPRVRWSVLGVGAALGSLAYIFVFWSASLNAYRQTFFNGWEMKRAQYRPLWQFVAENVPSDATVAYANTYMIYPLQGFTLDRRLVYAPTRPGVQTPADLAWLGDHLPGEQLVPAAVRATTANADRKTWLGNLQRLNVQYLVVAKSDTNPSPPELSLLAGDPHFTRKFEDAGGVVYAIDLPLLPP
jgi:hypothetical protein